MKLLEHTATFFIAFLSGMVFLQLFPSSGQLQTIILISIFLGFVAGSMWEIFINKLVDKFRKILFNCRKK